MELRIEVEEEFDLEKAICNHGLFMTLPNQWDPVTKSLQRPLRLADGDSSVMVSFSSPIHSNVVVILVHHHNSLSLSDQRHIQKQVTRMLRLSNKDKDDVRRFQEMHGEARSKGFGRLFRSPDLFEDVLKTILLCGVTWKRTLEMCQYLCELQAELESGMHKEERVSPEPRNLYNFFRTRKRKRDHRTNKKQLQSSSSPSSSSPSPSPSSSSTRKPLGNFPNAKELAGLSKEFLESRCQLGYRAKYILQLAKKLVDKGRLRLPEELEDTHTHPFIHHVSFFEDVRNTLLKLKGIGPFAAANILMCMGDYRYIPTDTETVQHLRQVHGMKNCQKDTVEKDAGQVYDKFGPYQCLAYWYEQVESYEKKLGQKLSELSPSSYHKVATGSYLSNNNTREQANKTKEGSFASVT